MLCYSWRTKSESGIYITRVTSSSAFSWVATQRAGADHIVWLFLSGTKFKHSDFVCESQRVCRQDELIGRKPQVVKWLWLWLASDSSGSHHKTDTSRSQWSGIAAMRRFLDSRQPVRTSSRKMRNRWGWKPLPSNIQWKHIRLRILNACSSKLYSVWIRDSALTTCSFGL
jgi:hypothetical protein